MNVKWGLAALAGLAMTGLSVGTVLATTSTTPKASILGQAEFSDFDLNSHTIPADVWHAIVHTQGQSDLYVVDNSIPHGTTTGWHSHPGPSWVLVVRGTVTTTPLTIAVGLRTAPGRASSIPAVIPFTCCATTAPPTTPRRLPCS